jgi:hypothetical protein
VVTFRTVGDPGIGATGSKVWPINGLGTALTPLVPGNPYREFIQFSNPGTVTVYVAMATDANGNPLAPSIGSLAGAFAVMPGATFVVSGECQLPWSGFAASGSSNSITVRESNIS